MQLSVCQEGAVIFPEGIRIRARPRRETYGAVSGADRADAPHTTGLIAYKEGVDTGVLHTLVTPVLLPVFGLINWTRTI
jgi:hypothetical protein